MPEWTCAHCGQVSSHQGHYMSVAHATERNPACPNQTRNGSFAFCCPVGHKCQTRFAIVDTDNFGRDYPNEQFVGEPFASKAEAQRVADELNVGCRDRWKKVVKLPYELEPEF